MKPCTARSKEERIRKWKMVFCACPGKETTAGQGCAGWWRQKPRCLPLLCRTALHPDKGGWKELEYLLKSCHKGIFFVHQKAGARWKGGRGHLCAQSLPWAQGGICDLQQLWRQRLCRWSQRQLRPAWRSSALTCVSPVSGRKRNSSSRQGFTRG